ncbi:glycosyl transferase family 2 [Nanoarchaeota archaeon]
MILFIITYIIKFLIFFYPLLFYIYHLFLYNASKSSKGENDTEIKDYPYLSIIVPIKGEKIEIIKDLIDNISKLRWDKEKLEIIIVSDDSEEYFNEIKRSIKIPDNLKVYLYRREEKLGYKSGALLYGYRKSRGDLILTIDVDSRLPEDSIVKLYSKMVKNNCDVITLRWIGYSQNNRSSIAKGLIVLTSFFSKIFFEGKEKAGLLVLPIGSGTLFKREALDDVGGWDYKLIQDDLEIGTRLIYKNKKICASDIPIYVEVPDNFFSFYVQQTRWSMGTGEVFRNRLKYIIKSKISFYKKLDLIFYLFQYTPILFIFISSILLVILIPFINYDPLMIHIPLFIIIIILYGIIGIIYIKGIYKIAKELNLDIIDILFSLSRISAFTLSISPFISYYFLKGLISNKKVYIVTPKGGNKIKNSYNILIIGVFGLIFLISSIIYFLHQYYFSSLWLFYYSINFIYTNITFNK